jgi:hypothetical protein
MITVIRLQLMSDEGLFEFIKDNYKAWRKSLHAMRLLLKTNHANYTGL